MTVVGPLGSEMLSLPMTIPLGPSTTVSPFASIKVVGVAGKLKVVPSNTIPEDIKLVPTLLGGVSEAAGSKVKVTPSVVNAKGPVAEGNPIVSLPTTIPEGPRTMEVPLSSIVVDMDGKGYVVPPMTTLAGVVSEMMEVPVFVEVSEPGFTEEGNVLAPEPLKLRGKLLADSMLEGADNNVLPRLLGVLASVEV